MYSIWSTSYLEYDLNPYNCYVNETLWRKINNEQISNRMFAKINKGNKFWICAIGAPINTDFPEDYDAPNIFVPRWMIEQINCEGCGEQVEVDWMPCEAFDESTKVVLKHLEGEEVENIQELLSNELTKLAILQKGSIIEVADLRYIVVNLEPASIVLCQGDDVELEFEISRPPTPMPEIEELLLPSAPPAEEPSSGRVLGGAQRGERFNPWRNKDFKPSSN